MAVYVVDEMMGRGKSCAMINFVNSASRDKKFIYIVPYNTECDRVMSQCKYAGFKSPWLDGHKLEQFKEFLSDDNSIVCTHKLFSMFDDDVFEMLSGKGYTLIMDEVIGVIDKVSLSKDDAETIFGKYAFVDENKRVHWLYEEYEGKFDAEKFLVKNGDVFVYNKTNWYSLIPERYYSIFDDVYIMTYMFRYQLQRAYFDLKGIPYTYKYVNGDSVENYTISDIKQTPEPVDYGKMIHVVDRNRWNKIGDGYFDLSVSWYNRERFSGKYEDVMRYMREFFRTYAKTPANKNMWTCFFGEEDKDRGGHALMVSARRRLAGNGFARGFVACNAKGTNEFRDKVAIAYPINRFMDTYTFNFLNSQGFPVDQEGWALQEMLQFLFRSAIRDGKEIFVYIPSRRMRELLLHWIKEVSQYGEMRDLPVVGRL